jgi:hypothetical protein
MPELTSLFYFRIVIAYFLIFIFTDNWMITIKITAHYHRLYDREHYFDKETAWYM